MYVYMQIFSMNVHTFPFISVLFVVLCVNNHQLTYIQVSSHFNAFVDKAPSQESFHHY